MSLSLLAIVAAPLFLSLGWTHAQFKQVRDLEAFLIDLDNAAIVRGRSARSAWNELQKANRETALLDGSHHIAHACAHSVGMTPECLAADKAFEQRLKALHLGAAVAAQAIWKQGGRLTPVPIQVQTCRFCGTPFWEIGSERSEKVGGQWGDRRFENTVHWLGRSLRGEDPWDYSIEAESNEGNNAD